MAGVGKEARKYRLFVFFQKQLFSLLLLLLFVELLFGFFDLFKFLLSVLIDCELYQSLFFLLRICVLFVLFLHLYSFVPFQLQKSSLFKDSPFVEHINLITVHNRLDSVRNCDSHFFLRDFVESALNEFLVPSVERGSGFVQEEYPWILQKSPRDRESLLLSARNLASRRACKGFEFVFETVDEVVGLRLPQCVVDLLLSGGLFAEEQILP